MTVTDHGPRTGEYTCTRCGFMGSGVPDKQGTRYALPKAWSVPLVEFGSATYLCARCTFEASHPDEFRALTTPKPSEGVDLLTAYCCKSCNHTAKLPTGYLFKSLGRVIAIPCSKCGSKSCEVVREPEPSPITKREPRKPPSSKKLNGKASRK